MPKISNNFGVRDGYETVRYSKFGIEVKFDLFGTPWCWYKGTGWSHLINYFLFTPFFAMLFVYQQDLLPSNTTQLVQQAVKYEIRLWKVGCTPRPIRHVHPNLQVNNFTVLYSFTSVLSMSQIRAHTWWKKKHVGPHWPPLELTIQNRHWLEGSGVCDHGIKPPLQFPWECCVAHALPPFCP